MAIEWRDKNVLITGGAAFIGSNLADQLIAKGAKVRVVDNFSSGTLANIQGHLDSGKIELIVGDLLDPAVTRKAIEGQQVVFHLAADHGGRGYVDLHQVQCSTNLMLDSLVFKTCH